MAKTTVKEASKKKVFLKPHGYRALLTTDGAVLSFLAALIGYFIGHAIDISQGISVAFALAGLIAVIVIMVSLKPKEYVTVHNDSITFKGTRMIFLSYEASVKLSEIVKAQIYVLRNGVLGSTYLEIFLQNGQSHKFAKELFNTSKDFEEFKKIIVDGLQ